MLLLQFINKKTKFCLNFNTSFRSSFFQAFGRKFGIKRWQARKPYPACIEDRMTGALAMSLNWMINVWLNFLDCTSCFFCTRKKSILGFIFSGHIFIGIWWLWNKDNGWSTLHTHAQRRDVFIQTLLSSWTIILSNPGDNDNWKLKTC